ncbi:MAG TPA: thioesterase family protein [Gemmatimonadales bacterium]|nr:thioesterase family protein [Gemmatimonadales bacterium]
MSLLFRLILVVAAAVCRRSDLRPFDPSRLGLRVLPTDLDPNWHVNNGRYLTLMDLGRIDLVIRIGFLRVVFRHRWMPVLGGAVIRFQRPLALWQRYDLVTRFLGWDEKWMYFEQRFESAGKVYALAFVRALFRGRDGSVPSAEALRAGGIDGTSPTLPDAVLRWREVDAALV